MHTLSRLALPHLAGAFALPVLLAGCVGAPVLVEPVYAPAPAPVALQPVAPAAPVAPAVAYGSSCFAGFYQCQLAVAGPVGGQCTCPGIGAPSFGTIR